MSDPTREALMAHQKELASLLGREAATVIVSDLLAAISTTPAPLDVERLARAMGAAVAGNESDMETKGYDELAERFAREYAKP